MKFKYSYLTDEQIAFIANGCGGKGGLIKPPDFLFLASCKKHDFYYWRGCSEKLRKIYDGKFYKFMLEDIANARWYLKPHYHVWAYAYYKFVRLGGKKYFYYGLKMKTIADLHKEMEEAEHEKLIELNNAYDTDSIGI